MITEMENGMERQPRARPCRWMSEEYEPGLVSVIIPTYNRAHLVTEAMDSVYSQTYRPIELIVVDDGSTDNTPKVLEEWGKGHSGDSQFELRTFRQENKGASAARNLGAANCKGGFIIWHDSDDLMLPKRVELPLKRLLEFDADACVCGWEREGGKSLPPKVPGGVIIGYVAGMFDRSTIVWLYRRSLLQRIHRWREYLICWDDPCFFLDWILSLPAPSVATVPKVLCESRLTSGSIISRNHSRGDFEGRLLFLKDKLRETEDSYDPALYRQVMAREAAAAAVQSYRRFPALSGNFMEVWREFGGGASWSLSWFRRLVWALGGVPACSAYGQVMAYTRLLPPRLYDLCASRGKLH